MAIDTRKIRKYHQLKRTEAAISKQLKELNKEIKEELEPGDHYIGDYRVNISLKRKYELDEEWIRLFRPDLWDTCTRTIADPDLIESAYLRGEISDDTLRLIRGDASVITSLTVDENV